jgi:CRISPR-associated protein Cmr3
MTKQTIHIEAIDTLFFRDGKPFSIGDDVWADGVFPPLPSVIYGALRTTLMFQKGWSVEELEERTKNFKITNIYLLVGNEDSEFYPAFPFPYDLVKFKGKDPIFLERISSKTSSSNYELLEVSLKEKAEDAHGKSVVEQQYFDYYLKGDRVNTISNTSLSEYIISEPKVGITRSNITRTTSGDAEGKMYRVNMQRLVMIDKETFKNAYILKIGVEFEGIENLDKKGIFRLGGENKSVHYTTEENITETNISNSIHSNIVKVYLSTPAIFENGWCPKSFLKNEFDTIPFKLLTYSIGKPIYAGGFDMKEQKPKYMFKAVPAGSVYYLQTNSVEEAKQLAQKLTSQNNIFDEWIKNDSISEEESKQAQSLFKQGFGKIYIAAEQQPNS